MDLAVDRTQSLPAVASEASLVAELQAGSEDAFAYLLGVYQNPVFNLISHILGNDSEAADVLQEVFVKVFKGIRHFQGQSSLKTWIYRIALHEISNHRRGWLRRRLRETASFDHESHEETAASWREQAGRTANPYQVLEQAERQDLVKRALADLPPVFRAVVVLREIEDLSYHEIAEVLGIPEGTVKSRLLRGREMLRRRLGSILG
jgi:RNA polymerase sigma-70 factor (ECF subfamily)